MKNLKGRKYLFLIGIGSINLIHGILHILQFLQSLLLATSSLHSDHEHESTLDSILHSPVLAVVWAIIGFITLYVGIKDFRHHKKCDNEKHEH